MLPLIRALPAAPVLMARSLLLSLSLALVASPAAGQTDAAEDRPRGFYTGSLPFFYDLYTFRGDGGLTEVVAAFAVPAGELESRAHDDEVRYRFDVSLVLADTALQSVTRTDDSVFAALPRRLGGDHLLFTHVTLQARPSVNTVQRVVMTDASTPGVGQLYDAPFRIPDYSGTRLMLSDIALGHPGAESGWRRGQVTLAPFPTSQFPESAFDVYYEIYNLPYRHRYVTEIMVEPLGRGEGRAAEPPARLRFDGESDALRDGVVQEMRRVTASFPRGRYRLTVSVTDEVTGETARRSRVFRVRGWKPGATLVVALPRAARQR